jgi:hypothetical protein
LVSTEGRITSAAAGISAMIASTVGRSWAHLAFTARVNAGSWNIRLIQCSPW